MLPDHAPYHISVAPGGARGMERQRADPALLDRAGAGLEEGVLRRSVPGATSPDGVIHLKRLLRVPSPVRSTSPRRGGAALPETSGCFSISMIIATIPVQGVLPGQACRALSGAGNRSVPKNPSFVWLFSKLSVFLRTIAKSGEKLSPFLNCGCYNRKF